MYEAVRARPDGDATVARLADAAGGVGYGGVVVCNHSDAKADYDADAIAEATGVDVVEGITVRAGGPEQASGAIGNYRGKRTIVAVDGGTNALNRFAVEQERVDVLANPMAGSGDVNHVLAKAARENGVRIEFDLAPVLRSTGGQRVQAIQELRKLREIVTQYDAPYVVSAGPRSHLQLRAPRELRAVGEVIGFDSEAIEAGLREWGELAERNRTIQSETFIEPGVEQGRYDDAG
ncbi:ribonuclease P/MRP protein subunit RPP1 [Natronoarchaeum philippinense]|uniref:Ribonuclease P protein component 3 n=1 Tax=Natronoarchaeum philippinense TaxID=558529 RepID=A0A285N037_NATPI|nr:RNase P subunit p30 family protein [Natronoarchaeum philippinense]SNZ02799.1 ribonuclease P/MRP protein subunit RPP1 [Natronoarchaeum philippinense]